VLAIGSRDRSRDRAHEIAIAIEKLDYGLTITT
jgi:hypothetical protein